MPNKKQGQLHFKSQEKSNYHQNGINLEKSRINSSFQDGVDNQELGHYHSLQKIPTLNHAQEFHHEKYLYQHQKQQRIQHFSQNKFQAPPTEKFRDNQVHIKIPEQFPQEKYGRHPNLPWSSESVAPAWPPSQPHVLGHPPPRTSGKRPSKQAPATEATRKLPRQSVIYPTWPPVLSLNELVASIGQNSQQDVQQQDIEPNKQVQSSADQSHERLQYMAPVLPSIHGSNKVTQQNSARVSRFGGLGHAKAPAPPGQSYGAATLPVLPTNPIMLTPHGARPKMNLKRPTYEHNEINHNLMNEMNHTSHDKNAIQVTHNTEYPIAQQNINNENMIDQNQAKIRQLEKIKQEQEAIRKMFHNSKFRHLLDSRMYRPYSPKPAFIASFATRSKKPTFKCLACNYKTRGKSHFDAHHKSTMDSYMLSRWSPDQLQQRFPDHVIGVPDNLTLTNAGNNMDIPDQEYYTRRPDKPTQRPSTAEQRNNLHKMHEVPRTENNHTLPIQWDLKQPIPGTTIEELNQQYTCNAAMA